MPRMTVPRFPRLAALLVAAVLGLALAAAASADAPPGRGPNGGTAPTPSPTPPGGDCAVLRVRLNGAQPATETCLATTQAMQGTNPSSRVSLTYCWPNDVHLYQDTNYGGKYICLWGEGTANLDSYYLCSWWQTWPFCSTWNDKVSSFSSGEHYITFYEHRNAGGAKFRVIPWISRTYMWTGWNDRASSICLSGTSWGCP